MAGDTGKPFAAESSSQSILTWWSRGNDAESPQILHRATSRFWPLSPAGSFVQWEKPGMWRTVLCMSLYLFVAYLTLGMMAPELPTIVLERACRDQGLAPEACRPEAGAAYDRAQKASAQFLSLLSIVGGVMSVLLCGFYGALGDSFGRKWPVFMPLIAGVFYYASWAFLPAARMHDALLLVSFLVPCFGGQFVINHAANACVADVTQHATPKQRSRMFGIVEAANWAGVMVGPTLGGWCMTLLGSQRAFVVNFAIAALNLLLMASFFRETLEPERRKPFKFEFANPVRYYRLFLHNRFTLQLALMLMLAMLAGSGCGAIVGNRFLGLGFGPKMLGYYGSVSLGAGCIGLIFLFPFMTRRMTLPRVLVIAMVLSAISWLGLAFAQSTAAIFLMGGTLLFGAVHFPIMRAGMTITFGKTRYGESLAAMGTLEQTMNMVAPPIMLQLYALYEDKQLTFEPSFLLGSLLLLCAAGVCCCMRRFPEAAD